jgi:hypothetical protein
MLACRALTASPVETSCSTLQAYLPVNGGSKLLQGLHDARVLARVPDARLQFFNDVIYSASDAIEN